MPARTLEEIAARFETLPTAKRLALLDALSAGDLGAAVKAGGGVSRAQLADLQPTGETGKLLDTLEKRAFFQHTRTLDIALMRALPAALAALRGIAEATDSHGEAESPEGDGNDKHAQALRIVQAQMRPRLCEQRRIAALSLFDLAEKRGLFTLAKEYRAPDIEADEEAALARMAKEQGIDLSGYEEKPEQPLRRVK